MLLIYIQSHLNNNQINKIKNFINSGQYKKIILTGHVPNDIELRSFFIKEYSIEIDILNYIDKILIIDNREDMRKDINCKLLTNIFSIKPVEVNWLNIQGKIESYRRSGKSDTLFIFPGSILPLSMGSHQRSFNLIYNLTNSGFSVDILIPENSKIDKKVLASALGCVAENVYFYKDRRKKLSKIQLIKRYVEKKIRAFQGLGEKMPDLFSERNYQKPTESLKRWVNSLYLAKNYHNIIVSYAWMLNSIQYIEHMKDKFNLICDTHDVQFYRNRNILNRKQRLFFDKYREKRLEINLLNKCDYVLAISEADKEILQQNITSTVLEAFPGFNYAKSTIKQRPKGRPIHFGFIGGSMEANIVALNFILKNWWPIIRKHSPDSKLYIAGSVSNTPEIIKESFFDKNIILLGFVKNIFDFYNEIEVALNPVIITGGLNFKSVEAVCAGKHLFTNLTGLKCLTADFPCTIIEKPEDITTHMNRIEFNLIQDKKDRMHAQNKALSLFGNKSCIQQLNQNISFNP